jgi:cobalamin biosynthetic protein CobC
MDVTAGGSARDHGGNLDRAIATFGGPAADWIDLSTGINRQPFPVPPLTDTAWTGLPTRAAIEALHGTARAAWGVSGAILATAGAQAAIQLVPRLRGPGRARVLGPTYNEHLGALRDAGWQAAEVPALDALAGADLAIVVNPNNPDGRRHAPADLLALVGQVGLLVVDESFADPTPELSLAGATGRDGLSVLRSFGKFYGLAGVRLGFALGCDADIARLAGFSGPWPVSGAAIEIGCAALADIHWSAATIWRLRAECDRIDALAANAGWSLVGGCELFRTYDTPNAAAAQDQLARARIWTRRFPYSERWLRLGLPGSEAEWRRLAAALDAR